MMKKDDRVFTFNSENQDIPYIETLNIKNLKSFSKISIDSYHSIKTIKISDLRYEDGIELKNLDNLEKVEIDHSRSIILILGKNLPKLRFLSILDNCNPPIIVDEYNNLKKLKDFKLFLTGLDFIYDSRYENLTNAIFKSSSIFFKLETYNNLEYLRFICSSSNVNANFPALKSLCVEYYNDKFIPIRKINFNDSTFPLLEQLFFFYPKDPIKIKYEFKNLKSIRIESDGCRKQIKSLDLNFREDHPILEEFDVNTEILISASLMKVIPVFIRNKYRLIES